MEVFIQKSEEEMMQQLTKTLSSGFLFGYEDELACITDPLGPILGVGDDDDDDDDDNSWGDDWDDEELPSCCFTNKMSMVAGILGNLRAARNRRSVDLPLPLAPINPYRRP